MKSLLALGLLAAPLAAAVTPGTPAVNPLMTTRGAPVLEDTLQVPNTKWKAAKGHWTVVDEALRGEEVDADHHPAADRLPLAFQDGILQFEVRLDTARAVSLSLGGAGGHLARLVLTPQGFQARKDDHDHDGPDKAVKFNAVKAALDPASWHTVTVEVLGDRLLAHVDGQTAASALSFGQAGLIGQPKTSVGLTVQGGAASFRNFGVWAATPNAAWSDPAPLVKGKK